jgi:hypothetical protein
MDEPIFTKLGMYNMAPEPVSTAYFMNLSHQSVYMYMYPLNVDRQRLHRNVTEAMNTHAKIK